MLVYQGNSGNANCMTHKWKTCFYQSKGLVLIPS